MLANSSVQCCAFTCKTSRITHTRGGIHVIHVIMHALHAACTAAGYMEVVELQDIFLAQPFLCSRVYGAAARACTPQVIFSVGSILPVAQVVNGMDVAAQACRPEQLPAQSLLTNTRLAARMGSQVCTSRPRSSTVLLQTVCSVFVAPSLAVPFLLVPLLPERSVVPVMAPDENLMFLHTHLVAGRCCAATGDFFHAAEPIVHSFPAVCVFCC